MAASLTVQGVAIFCDDPRKAFLGHTSSAQCLQQSMLPRQIHLIMNSEADMGPVAGTVPPGQLLSRKPQHATA